MTGHDAQDLHCSALTRTLDERPAGTAGSWHRAILVELPLPWPDHIEAHPLLADRIPPAAPGRRHRILGLASALSPEDATPDDGLRVICYWRPVDATFGRFARAEICAPLDDVAEIVAHLVEADDEELAATPTDSFAAGAALGDLAVRDLLVCTHGSRDRCCGQFGINLFRTLDTRVPPDVRLWRTSHTGGHRFAPTGLTFPDGGTWSGLDDDLALGLIDRSVPAALAAAHARGSAGIPAGAGQAADIAALERLGWAWYDTARAVTVVADPADGPATVALATGTARYRAVVRPGREVPVPVCGHPLDAARKTTVEWVLESFAAV